MDDLLTWIDPMNVGLMFSAGGWYGRQRDIISMKEWRSAFTPAE